MLVSVHMPKTSGTAFRYNVLEPAFGKRLLLDYADRPLAHSTNERNQSAKAFRADEKLIACYDCIHGHFLAAKYLCENPSFKFATWFRDPVQRMISRYRHGKRTRGGGIGPHTTIEEFCEMERFQNTYAKYLWSFELDWFDFVGITGNYADSVKIFCRVFNLPGGTNAIHNANPEKEVGLAYPINDSLRKRIVYLNQEDMDIYQRALVRYKQMRRKWL